MKPYAVLTAIMAMLLIASSALAATSDEFLRPMVFDTKTSVTYKTVDTRQIKATVKFRPPPLILPDIKGRVWKLKRVDRSLLPDRLKKSTQAIGFFTNPKNRWMIAPQKEKCWDVPWQRLCTLARAKLRLNHELAETAQYRLDHELPLIGDWRTAVRWIQRIYPGTESWLLYISDREGGYGPWVWYGGHRWSGYHIGNDYLGADTVGGWMQFRFSTFAPYYRGMVKDMVRRGYQLPTWPDRGGPAIYQPWLDPLAQALTAGYMKYYGKEGCHWCL